MATSAQVADAVQKPPNVNQSDESEDESEDKILETGGGGRWQKNNQQVPIVKHVNCVQPFLSYHFFHNYHF